MPDTRELPSAVFYRSPRPDFRASRQTRSNARTCRHATLPPPRLPPAIRACRVMSTPRRFRFADAIRIFRYLPYSTRCCCSEAARGGRQCSSVLHRGRRRLVFLYATFLGLRAITASTTPPPTLSLEALIIAVFRRFASSHTPFSPRAADEFLHAIAAISFSCQRRDITPTPFAFRLRRHFHAFIFFFSLIFSFVCLPFDFVLSLAAFVCLPAITPCHFPPYFADTYAAGFMPAFSAVFQRFSLLPW